MQVHLPDPLSLFDVGGAGPRDQIMPASLVAASFEHCAMKEGEKVAIVVYSVMCYAEHYTTDQWAGLTVLIVGGAIERRLSDAGSDCVAGLFYVVTIELWF